MDFWLDRFASPVGVIQLVYDGEGLRALDFIDFEDRLQRLLRLHYGACRLMPAETPGPFRPRLDAYFAGDLAAIDDLPVKTGGTAFQRAVWTALRQIPAGTTISYATLAARIGKPKAMRAVGLANGANPVGIVVPCHRVIGASGALTGYGGGLPRKRWLLDHEQRVAEPGLFDA
jgi:methylated-DNA-[protein]-cysteine S-methyltransferase